MLRQSTDLNFKCRYLVKMIQSLTSFREISLFENFVEAHSGFSHVSKLEPLARIANSFKLSLLKVSSKMFEGP